MKVQFTFKHMETSRALMELAEEKLLAKINKFSARPVHAHVTFSVEGILQKMHVTLITGDGFDVEAEHSGEDLYSEIDVVCEKVESQLRRHKERVKHRRASSQRRELFANGSVAVSQSHDESIDAGDILNFEAGKQKHPHLSTVCGK